MATEALKNLSDAGVSVWLDDLSRPRLTSGSLARLITEQHVVGVTTNPSIFDAALKDSSAYAEQMEALRTRGVDVGEAVRSITTSDVRWACDVMSAASDHRPDHADGRVSIEVDPRLLHETEKTIAEGKALWWLVDRPNLFIKVPASDAGLPAITALIAAGISVNVTLIFSVARYKKVVDAYFDGLEQRVKNGLSLTGIASVASFFVSRVDTEIDKRLTGIGTPEAMGLRGKAGLANARLAYQQFEVIHAGERWAALKTAGALVQRPLWASTGVKDPALPDTMYVTGLVAADTVNTMPEKTMQATADHGVVELGSITNNYADAAAVWDALKSVGIDLPDVDAVLEKEGGEKFVVSWQHLLQTIQEGLDGSGAAAQ